MRLLIAGPPGVGKGTQSTLVAARLQIPAISTGDMFRAMQVSHSDLATEVRETMSSGRYVSDELTNRIVVHRLSQVDCDQGFLLDGYPRTLPQLDFLHQWLAERGTEIDAVICLEAAIEVTTQRMTARATVQKRSDDTSEAFRVRLQLYEAQTRPLLDIYEELQLLHKVDGTGPVEQVFNRVTEAVERL